MIGASGAKAYRAALATISENISNANTENYARRTIQLRESAASSVTSPLYVPKSNFGGAEIGGIRRQTDAYLDAATRLSGNILGSADQRLRWNGDIETALNDTTLGVGQRLSEMFSAVQKLAANPADTSLRTNVVYGVEQVVTAFGQAGTSLAEVTKAISGQAGIEVATLNDALVQLANANEGLRRVVPGTSAEAQLLDSRDSALDTISQKLNVAITFKDHGVAQVDYAGKTIVESVTPTAFSFSTNSDGTIALAHEGAAIGEPSGGSIGGLVESAKVARDRTTSLNALASQFASDLNGWHAGGLTDAGTAGGPLVSYDPALGAAGLAVTITNISQIAARSSDGTLNGNLIAINSIRGTNGVENGWTALVAQHANMMTTTKLQQEAAEARDGQTRSARSDVSGVDLDVEAADLLRFQQAYQAAARVMQVGRETVQAILDIF